MKAITNDIIVDSVLSCVAGNIKSILMYGYLSIVILFGSYIAYCISLRMDHLWGGEVVSICIGVFIIIVISAVSYQIFIDERETLENVSTRIRESYNRL